MTRPDDTTPMSEVASRLTIVKEGWGASDRAVLKGLVQDCDIGQDFVEGTNNYVWWFLIGDAFRPRVIAEMGTRFGYSLWSLVSGADHLPAETVLHVWDDERDYMKTLHVMEDWMTQVRRIPPANLHIHRVDVQTLTTLGIDEQADLVVVDAWHSEEGCLHECRLAWEACRDGGILVVDDTRDAFPGYVRKGMLRFVEEVKADWCDLPSLRGVTLIRKPEWETLNQRVVQYNEEQTAHLLKRIGESKT